MTQVPLGRVNTRENYADMFTDTLTSTTLQFFLSPWYMLGVNRNNNSQVVLNDEFRRRETCESCNHVDTGDFLSVGAEPLQPLHFQCLLSYMRIADARAEVASEELPAETNMTQRFSLAVAGIICVLIVCWSPSRHIGACGRLWMTKNSVVSMSAKHVETFQKTFVHGNKGMFHCACCARVAVMVVVIMDGTTQTNNPTTP